MVPLFLFPTKMKTRKMVAGVSLLLFCIFIVSPCYASKKKLFEQAIKNGAPNGLFIIDNTKKEHIKIWAMRKYVAKNGYVAVDGKSDIHWNLINLYFIRPENYTEYVIYALSSNKDLNLNQLKGEGKVFLPQRETKQSFWGWKSSKDYIAEPEVAQWSGSVVDGFINGRGSGIIKKGDNRNCHYFFEGEFKRGLPVSKTTIKKVHVYLSLGTYRDGTVDKPETIDFDEIDGKKYIELKESSGIEAKRAIDRHLANLQPDLPEKYIKYAKEVIKSGKTPILSEDITGENGVVKIKYFSGNANEKNNRNILEAMATQNAKAKEALNYMQLLDGMYLSSPTIAKSIKEGVNDRENWWYWDKSNFWGKMNDAFVAASKLKKLSSASNILTKIEKAEQNIKTWGKSLENDREQMRKKISKSVKNFLGSVWDDAVNNSKRGGSSGSSSSSSNSSSYDDDSDDSSSDPDVENMSIPSFKYITEWQTELMRNKVTNKYGENQVREIKFSDGIETKIARVAGENGYWVYNGIGGRRYRTLDDAVAAAYIYEKYDKVRQKGRW